MASQGSACDVVISSPHALEAAWLASIITGAGCRARYTPTVEALADALRENEADVVLLDGCHCGDDMATVRDLVQQQHKVVILIDRERPGSFLHQAFRAGAKGCLLCDEQADRFAESVRLAAQGMVVMSDDAARILASTSSDGATAGETSPFTDLEQQLASLVAQGATNREIGEQLFISEHTVKVHLRDVLKKLGLRNRHHLAAYVAAHGGTSAGTQQQS
jgi:DNA-binding NarL/FixJ family response regulator